MKKKLSPRFWCALTLLSFIGQIAWVVENMYFNVFIYKMFHASAADISAMVSASAVAATLTTVLVGALSDKIGKRKIFICAGYIAWGISIFSFAFLRIDIIESLFPKALSAASVGISLVIVMDCVMTFFGSSANDAAFNAWLTDSADSSNRGAAEGINAMMPLVAILAVFGGFMSFNLDSSDSWVQIFTIIGIIVTAVGILSFFMIEDSPAAPSEAGYFSNVIHGFLPSTIKQYPQLYLYLTAFILFNISIQIFMPYLIIYYEVSLGMSNYVFVMAPAIILASVVTALWGKVYDKKGFSFSAIFSLLWLSCGYILLFFTSSTLPVFLGSLLMMCGYLSGMAVFGAKIRDLTPSGKAGRFQGIRIFSQVLIPGVAGPFIGKTILANAETILNNDGTTSFVPNSNIFLAALAVAVLLAIILILIQKNRKPHLCELTTPFEYDSFTAWDEYPRPQMKRDSYLSLCGEWELSVKKYDSETPLGTILVPFPPESRLSGIQRSLRKNESYLYRKTFLLDDTFANGCVLLHFGAADQNTTVYLNGYKMGENKGGYLPFTIDITNAIIIGENHLVVEITDQLDTTLPYGKQRKKRGGMWYTPISGIWQPVWLEAVPEEYLTFLRITPTLETVTIDTNGGIAAKQLILHLPEGDREYNYTGDSITISIPSPRLWTPETPYLYFFTLICGEDKIDSYFALRTISVGTVNNRAYILLNNKPYFFHALLDQGYFSDGIYLPASPDGFINDIQKCKELGFNTLRKHIKIEPELFYYYCDKYGMIVFQDMVNNGRYSFFRDTALPTIGIKRLPFLRASYKRRELFEQTAHATIDHLYNHPCVCYYTIFNEGWGQYDADRLYDNLRSVDPTRIWDATSGWFIEKKSDVTSDHVYFKKVCSATMSDDPNRPMVLSEFGGYSCKLPGHAFNLDNTYGYRFFNNTAELTDAFDHLYRDEIIPMIRKGLCAAVMTQVSDVEDETNGMMTYDRQIVKPDSKIMVKLAHDLQKTFEEQTNIR